MTLKKRFKTSLLILILILLALVFLPCQGDSLCSGEYIHPLRPLAVVFVLTGPILLITHDMGYLTNLTLETYPTFLQLVLLLGTVLLPFYYHKINKKLLGVSLTLLFLYVLFYIPLPKTSIDPRGDYYIDVLGRVYYRKTYSSLAIVFSSTKEYRFLAWPSDTSTFRMLQEDYATDGSLIYRDGKVVREIPVEATPGRFPSQ